LSPLIRNNTPKALYTSSGSIKDKMTNNGKRHLESFLKTEIGTGYGVITESISERLYLSFRDRAVETTLNAKGFLSGLAHTNAKHDEEICGVPYPSCNAVRLKAQDYMLRLGIYLESFRSNYNKGGY